jgi:hypothetical protein
VKFKDMGSGSCSTIVEESDEIDGGRSNCFFVAIGSLLFPSSFKSSPMETGSVCDQDAHQDMVHGLACTMRDNHATVLSHLSDLRADHPYLINIEHMFLGMISPEKDDDPKFIRYHNRSVGEDESGIDVRRSLKAYSAYIRDDDDYIEDLDIIVAASMYGVNIAIIECYKDVVVTPADGDAPNQEESTTTPADSQCWKPYVTILAPLPIDDHGGDAPDSVTNPLFQPTV